MHWWGWWLKANSKPLPRKQHLWPVLPTWPEDRVHFDSFLYLTVLIISMPLTRIILRTLFGTNVWAILWVMYYFSYFTYEKTTFISGNPFKATIEIDQRTRSKDRMKGVCLWRSMSNLGVTELLHILIVMVLGVCLLKPCQMGKLQMSLFYCFQVLSH